MRWTIQAPVLTHVKRRLTGRPRSSSGYVPFFSLIPSPEGRRNQRRGRGSHADVVVGSLICALGLKAERLADVMTSSPPRSSPARESPRTRTQPTIFKNPCFLGLQLKPPIGTRWRPRSRDTPNGIKRDRGERGNASAFANSCYPRPSHPNSLLCRGLLPQSLKWGGGPVVGAEVPGNTRGWVSVKLHTTSRETP